MDNSEKKIETEGTEQIIVTKDENSELETAEGIGKLLSSMDIKNAPDEIGNNEQKAKKKSLKFGGWLSETLAWNKREELAQSSLPTSSLIFNGYCWPKLHGRVKPRIVPKLTFSRKKDAQGNWQTILEKGGKLIPIAEVNPPEYIKGFEKIKFKFIDGHGLQFVENILPLLKEDIEMDFRVGKLEDNPEIGSINRMMELLALKTNKLISCVDLNKFNEQFPNFIDGVQLICLPYYKEINKDLAVKWVTTPREDGKPKMLRILTRYYSNMKALINRVKEEFVHSNEPANFFITMMGHSMSGYKHDDEGQGYEDFKIENETTKECFELLCHKSEGGEFEFYFLGRYKNIGETNLEDEIKKFEQMMPDEDEDMNTTIKICCNQEEESGRKNGCQIC